MPTSRSELVLWWVQYKRRLQVVAFWLGVLVGVTFGVAMLCVRFVRMLPR